MMRYLKLCVSLFAFLVLVACGGNGGGGAPAVDVTGSWSGGIVAGQDTFPFSMNLTQNGANVSGTVTIEPDTANISGTVNGNSVTLVVGEVTFSGTVVGETMNGTFTNANGTFNFSATRVGGAPGPTPPGPTPPGPTPPGPTPPTPGNLSGAWSGSGTSPEVQFSISMNLNEATPNVTGTVTFSGDLNGQTDVSGTVSGGTVTLTGSPIPVQMTATVTGTSMTGNGSVPVEDEAGNQGVINFDFTATKQ